MAEPISIQQLKDASLDVKSLEEVVNGDENVVVTTRLGETYPSVKGSIKKVFETGGLPATPFATKALMTASALVDGQYAQVTDDTIADNNGLYQKSAGAWVKSSYNPIGLLNAYKDEASYLVANSDDFNISGFVTETGGFPIPNNYRRTPHLSVLPDTEYVIDSKTTGVVRHAWYDKNKVFVSAFGAEQTSPLIVTSPANAAYLVASKFTVNTTASVKYKNVGYNISKIRDIIKTAKLDISSDDVKNNGQTLTQYQANLAAAQGHENRNNYVSVAPALGSLYSDSMSAELKKGLRGEVVYEPDTKMLHIPAQMMIMTGSGSYLTTATSIDLTTDLAATSLLRIYYDTTDRVFVPLGAAIVIAVDLRAKYVLFASIRVSIGTINIEGNFDYRIGLGRGGETIHNDRPSVIGSHKNAANTLNSVNFDTKNGLMQIPQDTIFKYGSYIWATPEKIDIDLRSAGSSALRIYWSLLDNTFLVAVWNPDISFSKRFTHVLIASVRNYTTVGVVSSDRIEVDYTGYYTIDGKPYGITEAVTPMLMDDTIKGTAHRGYSTLAPENTLPAYVLAKKMGFYYVETDVLFSLDEVPVIHHDETINRTSNGTGKVAELTLAQLKTYDFGAKKHANYIGTKIPTLKELLQLCFKLNLHIYLEVKPYDGVSKAGRVDTIISTVKECGMEGRVSYIGSASVLNMFKLADPNARLGNTTTASSATIDATVALKTATNSVFLNAEKSNITKVIMDEARGKGVPVEVWTVNTPSEVAPLAALGIQGIATDILNIRQILNDDAGV